MAKFTKVASVSGGKDSVAMLILMKEKIDVIPDYIVYNVLVFKKRRW